MRVRGPWYDLGSPSLYLASHQSLLASRFRGARRGSVIHPEARVHPRARVVRSVVGRGAVIASGAVVRGSVLWERVKVGRDAVVAGQHPGDGSRGGGRRVPDLVPAHERPAPGRAERGDVGAAHGEPVHTAAAWPPWSREAAGAAGGAVRSRVPRRSHARPARLGFPVRSLRRARGGGPRDPALRRRFDTALLPRVRRRREPRDLAQPGAFRSRPSALRRHAQPHGGLGPARARDPRRRRRARHPPPGGPRRPLPAGSPQGGEPFAPRGAVPPGPRPARGPAARGGDALPSARSASRSPSTSRSCPGRCTSSGSTSSRAIASATSPSRTGP